MNKRLTQLKALSTEEWQLLLSSLLLLPAIALALRLRGLKWTQAFLQNRAKDYDTARSQDTLKTAESVARMVGIAARHGPYRANCLKQSLATWWLLLRRGIVSDLKIGVNTDAGDFSAHAWVEYRGNVLLEADNVGDHYSTFDPQ